MLEAALFPPPRGRCSSRSGRRLILWKPGKCSMESARFTWRPIYVFVRAAGYDYDDAQDLTQRFILHLIGRERFTRADPARGQFRSYIIGALKYFLAHVRQEARAQERGGGAAVVPLDEAIIGTIGNTTALH